MGKPKVFIATPNLGEIATGNVLNLLSWFGEGKYDLRWYAPQHVKPWDRARNLCHKAFLESDYDYLFFLDEHTVPPVDVIDRLLAHDVPVVSGTAQIFKRGALIPMALRKDEDGYRPHWGDGLERVDTTTLACTLIKKEVMERVKRPAFMFTQTDEWGIEGLSEDIFFAERVVDAGFEEYNDYGILCDHSIQTSSLPLNNLLTEASNG